MSLVLQSLESQRSIVFGAEDVREWPQGVLQALLDAGILREVEFARSVICQECPEACSVDVHFVDGGQGQESRAFIECTDRDDIGRVYVPLERLRTWRLSPKGLAEWVAHELGAGATEEVAPGRLWWLGGPHLNERRVDVFLARGANWSDAQTVFGQVDRLQRCVYPIVLLPADMPHESPLSDMATVSLPHLLRLQGGEITLDEAGLKEAIGSRQIPVSDDGPFHHSPDFRSVSLNGQEFALTTSQAKVVECLWENYENRTPDVSQDYLIETVLDSTQSRLKDVFKNSDAWGTLIAPGRTRGTFRLNI